LGAIEWFSCEMCFRNVHEFSSVLMVLFWLGPEQCSAFRHNQHTSNRPQFRNVQDYVYEHTQNLQSAGNSVALCIAGQARYFADDDLKTSLTNFLDFHRNQQQIDVFAHMTLRGDGPKGQPNWDFEAVDANRGTVAQALRSVDAVSYELTDDSGGDVTEQNLDQIINEPICFQHYLWANLTWLTRQLNYFVHLRSCLYQMEKYEQKRGFEYTAVVFARPDLFYEGCAFDFERIKNGVIYKKDGYHIDWIFAAPRKIMYNFSQPVFQCLEGWACCHTLGGDTERYVTYLLDLHRAPEIIDTCVGSKVKRPTGEWSE